ncbi:transporter [Flagellimonas sp.]|uniref:transporter n=1 Tax=Flagellimonas sp. TaxID=2058762 RepID=UPI003B51B487
MKIFGSLLLFMAICTMNMSYAQTCCSGGVPLSNNLGLPNEGKGAFTLGISYDYNNLNTLNAGSDRLDDDSRLRITNSVLVSAGYAFTDRLSVESLLTWVNQLRTISQFGNETDTETRGIGDGVFLVKYAFPDLVGEKSNISIGGGIKIPFGRSDFTTPEGIQLTADLQLGSGAWDFVGLVSFSKNPAFRESATLSANFTMRFTGVNKDYLNGTSTYEFGNEIQGNAGYSDQFLWLNTIFEPSLVVKYRKAFVDKINASDLPNTGGEWIFIRPEISAALSPSLALVSKVEIPVHSFVEGTQLTPTLRVTAGIFVTLKRKNNTILNN